MKIDPEDLKNPLEEVQTTHYFRTHITGYIESGNFYEGDAVFCKYDFVTGTDWEIEDGINSGQTQYSCRGEGNYDYMVWNMPFEISYRSWNPSGWPQLVISCMSPDFLGRETIKGYGVVHVPTQPGRHERTVHIFSPITSSSIFNFIGILIGKKAEFNNAPKVLASGDGREITRTKSEGSIKVIFQVTTRDMDKFGYSIK